jgi:hypothetical protein
MPKFSVELLNMRKKQVLMARNKKYVEAEKIKRKADILEAFEIDNIRRAAKEENQIRFKVTTVCLFCLFVYLSTCLPACLPVLHCFYTGDTFLLHRRYSRDSTGTGKHWLTSYGLRKNNYWKQKLR